MNQLGITLGGPQLQVRSSTIQTKPIGTMRRSRLRGFQRKRKNWKVLTHMATLYNDRETNRISRCPRCSKMASESDNN